MEDTTLNQIKEKLHTYIHSSDLSGLKKYIDQLQRSLLCFDDPSLLMMAIDVYLTPKSIVNRNFQLDMIIFLSKCGLKFSLPGGKIILHFIEYFKANDDSDQEEFEEKLVTLLDSLLGYHKEILKDSLVSDISYYDRLKNYLVQHQAAYVIQNWWRKQKAIEKSKNF